MASSTINAGRLGRRIGRYEDFQVATLKTDLDRVKTHCVFPRQGLDESAILGSSLVARKVVAARNRPSATRGIWYGV
jgi:hypothetical protein